MADKKIKALTIKVNSKSEPSGVEYKWDKIPQIEVFTKDILIPEIAADKEGRTTVNIGTIVSGMPSVFARANLFRNALDNITDKSAQVSGLLLFYKSLINEWRGLISAIALNYKDVRVERVHLAYSDGKKLIETENIYEPLGAFGNVLFERTPLWCDQSLAENADKIPFIDVLTFNGEVVGGTSPDSFLFTSVAYYIREKFPFINITNGKFIDPLNSELQPDELNKIYGYAKHILNNIEKFRINYNDVDDFLKPNYSNLNGNIQDWMKQMEAYASKKGWPKLTDQTPPEVGPLFQYPFSLLFNYSTELFGLDGAISSEAGIGRIPFDPKDLLLPESTEIAQIENFGKEGLENKDFLNSKPIILLKAEIKGQPKKYSYFSLPLTPLALNVFGANLHALVGLDASSNIKSRLTGVYDPNDREGEKLVVQLKLYTESGNEISKQIIYNVYKHVINGQDILLWPNFISRQWNRYFLYSELPHNNVAGFQATPFIGDVNDDFFRIVLDEKNHPLYLAKDGKSISIPTKYGNIKTQLHIVTNNAVADNKYKYEIYESNQPFKGIKFSFGGKDCGYAIIRYDSMGTNKNLPSNKLKEPITELAAAYLGVDFGSTNTSIAYWSEKDNEVCGKIILENRRISLLSDDAKDNTLRPALEDEIFFFQNDEVVTNSIKSILTLHDPKRLVNEENIGTDSIMAKAVRGGFPCFENNLPIENAKNDRYILNFNRVGFAEQVYNMKWSTQKIDKSYKSAFLGSLLLHVYAQLFIEGHEPISLKWSYPSSMGKGLLSEYNIIWDSLTEINPIVSNRKLNIYPPDIDFGDTSGSSSWEGEQSGGGWGDTPSSPESSFSLSGSNDNSSWGETNVAPASGWGEQEVKKPNKVVSIKTDTGPIRFDFKPLGDNESMTEACAVANYLLRDYPVKPGELLLCFDIGGSTTDISALCQMEDGKAMIKQNSIRLAAQRIAHATSLSPNFQSVLLKICEKKKISIQGLNRGENKYNENTAPYFFEKVVDRMDDSDFVSFYQLIAAECKPLMCVNLYVTGLIMYYAGQIAFKLRNEILRSEDTHPAVKAIPPKINIAFAGKGARIFDWFPAVNPKAANDYYTQMFIRGIGGDEVARKTITPVNYPSSIININTLKKENNADVKYEVSKGLAIPAHITTLLVPRNKEAIEILGEEGFCIIAPSGDMNYLNYGNSITTEMMENIGSYFISSPQQGQKPCPKFMDFADLFFKVSTTLFGLKMNASDFMQGFQTMNIESFIKEDPDFIEAQKRVKDKKKFDYVAPIIILEGLKFYRDHLLKGIKKV